MVFLVVESSICVAKETSSFDNILVDGLGQWVVLMVKLLEDLIRIIGKSVSSLQFSLRKQTLLELQIPIAIVESAFERVAEHFVGF